MARHGDETHEDTIKLIKEGKKNKEIAELLGIPLPTVKSRRMRYGAQLKREELDSNPFESRKPKTALAEPSKSEYPPASDETGFTGTDSIADTIRLILAGKSNPEIVKLQGIPMGTVKNRRSRHKAGKYKHIALGDSDLNKADRSETEDNPKVVAFEKPKKKREASVADEGDAVAVRVNSDLLEAMGVAMDVLKQVEPPNLTLLKQFIWYRIQTTYDPAMQMRGVNALLRAMSLEQKLPAELDLDDVDSATMTNLERERLMVEIMQRGDLTGA